MKYENTPPLLIVVGGRVSAFWQRQASGTYTLDRDAWQRKQEDEALEALIVAERAARDVKYLSAGLDSKRVKLLRGMAVEIVDREQDTSTTRRVGNTNNT